MNKIRVFIQNKPIFSILIALLIGVLITVIIFLFIPNQQASNSSPPPPRQQVVIQPEVQQPVNQPLTVINQPPLETQVVEQSTPESQSTSTLSILEQHNNQQDKINQNTADRFIKEWSDALTEVNDDIDKLEADLQSCIDNSDTQFNPASYNAILLSNIQIQISNAEHRYNDLDDQQKQKIQQYYDKIILAGDRIEGLSISHIQNICEN